MIRLKDQVLSILEDYQKGRGGQEKDLRSFLQDALVVYFVEKMKSRPLVQIVLQEVSVPVERGKFSRSRERS